MRRLIAFFCVAGFAAVVGCAAHAPIVLRDPVGPQGSPPVTSGDLVVYSAPRVVTYAQSEYPVHTAYTIYAPNDQIVKHVDNLAGSFNQDPETVPLSPGEYHIKALAAGSGEVIVPVIIETGKTTVVDLDGTALPQHRHAQGQWVQLSDGHVVGWQADCNASDCQ